MKEITRMGEKDGKWTFWYKNGQKRSEGTYKGVDEIGHPLQQGKWTEWYENGQKKSEITYKDGKEDGLWTYWDENGQKKSEITYKDGWFTLPAAPSRWGATAATVMKNPCTQ